MNKDFKSFFYESVKEDEPKTPEQKFTCKVCDGCKYTVQKVDETIYPNYCPNCGESITKCKETEVIELSKIKPVKLPVYESTMLKESAIPEMMNEVLRKQAVQELANAVSYINLASKMNLRGLMGFANFFESQAKGEFEHSAKIREYLMDRNGRMEILDFPLNEEIMTEDVAELFDFTYQLEKKTTAEINKIVNLANDTKDNATITFLDWFLEEQIEEEKTVFDILKKVKLTNNDAAALITLDAML